MACHSDSYHKPYSDETARLMDDEVRNLIDSQYQRAKNLLTEKRHELNLLAQTLLERSFAQVRPRKVDW